MSKNKKIILGLLIGIPVFLGILGASQPTTSNVKSAATTRDAQLTISPIQKPTLSIAKPTAKPTPKPTSKPTVTPRPTSTPIPTRYIAPTAVYVQPTTAPATSQSSSGLSNNNYYTNTAGNEVHSPAYSTDNSVPAGATAKCGDGTYSFSQSHSGTCSHHGGVAQWL